MISGLWYSRAWLHRITKLSESAPNIEQKINVFTSAIDLSINNKLTESVLNSMKSKLLCFQNIVTLISAVTAINQIIHCFLFEVLWFIIDIYYINYLSFFNQFTPRYTKGVSINDMRHFNIQYGIPILNINDVFELNDWSKA